MGICWQDPDLQMLPRQTNSTAFLVLLSPAFVTARRGLDLFDMRGCLTTCEGAAAAGEA